MSYRPGRFFGPRILSCVAAVTALAAVTLQIPSAPSAEARAAGLPYAAGEVLVKSPAGAPNVRRANALLEAKATPKEQIHPAAMKSDGAEGIVRASTSLEVMTAVKALRANPAVEY